MTLAPVTEAKPFFHIYVLCNTALPDTDRLGDTGFFKLLIDLGVSSGTIPRIPTAPSKSCLIQSLT